MADPDLPIRGRGRSSDPEIMGRGGAGLPPIFFRPFGPQFGLKIRGRSPRSATVIYKVGR